MLARLAAGITQQALATAADVSRATVALIEAGCADPRLSTISALADALNVPAPILLLGRDETVALTAIAGLDGTEHLRSEDLAEMHRLLATGMLRDRIEAGRLALAALQEGGCRASSLTLGTVFSAILPGAGTDLGLKWAQTLLADRPNAS